MVGRSLVFPRVSGPWSMVEGSTIKAMIGLELRRTELVMSGRKVAITSISFSKSVDLLAELASHGLEPYPNRSGQKLEGQNLISFLRDSGARAAIVGLEPIDLQTLEQCQELRFISKYGVGLDNLDQEALRQRGVGLGWTGGVNRRSVSELALGFALGHFRNIVPSIIKMRQGIWEKAGGQQLSDATVGIVGFGHIGTDLAALLRPFGCRILYSDILDKSAIAADLGASPASYEEILAKADVITFHVPSTPLTKGMFGRRELGLVKANALIINTARGDIVDFVPTATAVRDGRLGGFAADVFIDEPQDLHSWADVPQLYFTPHIGGNAQEAILAMGRSAISHVVAFFARS